MVFRITKYLCWNIIIKYDENNSKWCGDIYNQQLDEYKSQLTNFKTSITDRN